MSILISSTKHLESLSKDLYIDFSIFPTVSLLYQHELFFKIIHVDDIYSNLVVHL